MAEALIFHYRHRHTLLSRANPLSKFISTIAICLSLFSLSLGGLGIVTVLLSLAMWHQRLPIIRYRRELRYFAFILLLIIVTEYLATRTIQSALVSALRFIAIIQCGLLLTDCTAADDLARSLGSVLDRIPLVDGWAVASTIEMTLALLPMIFDASLEVVTARTARLERKHRPLASLGGITSSIFSLILDKGEDLALALEARHFDPSQPRKRLPYTRFDAMLLTSVTFALIFARMV
jgi:biotin transport system permease protein